MTAEQRTYAVRVLARDRLGRDAILARLGGGGNTMAECTAWGLDYYLPGSGTSKGRPTATSTLASARICGRATATATGPDALGPWLPIETLSEYAGDDPLHAAATWPPAPTP